VTTRVEKTIEVHVPVRAAYNQWTQFEQFPQFMGGVQQVRQLSDTQLHWVAEIAGVTREWDAAILEQVPDHKVAWAATGGVTNAGAVHFQPAGGDRTLVRLSLEYEPEGLVEKVGDFLNVVEKQAQGDLEKFKQFIESRGVETGAWRGSVSETGAAGTPGVEEASASRGDTGKAGVSGTAGGAGLTTAGAGVAGAAPAGSGNAQVPSGAGSEDVESVTRTRSTIRAFIEDGPRAGETVEVDTQRENAPPKEFLLADEHFGARPADRPVPRPSGAVSIYRLAGPDEERGGYVYKVVRHEG
jgi:carbon monoxide dehydrogenase subunit G